MRRILISLVDAVLESPVFWGVIALVLGALAVSGKFSVRIANLLLVCAWVVGAVGIYRSSVVRDPRLMLFFILLLGAVLSLVSYWIRPPDKSISTNGPPDAVVQAEAHARTTRKGIHIEVVEAHADTNWKTTPWTFDSAVAVKVYLVNRGQPVGIRDYRLTIRGEKGEEVRSDRRVVDASYWRLYKKESTSAAGRLEVERRLEPFLDAIVRVNEPLPHGAGKDGWLLFLIDGIGHDECVAGSLVVSVVDAFGREYHSLPSRFTQPNALLERGA